MSRENSIFFRARLRDDGNIDGFFLSYYTGGGTTELFLYRLQCGDLFWVLEGDGFSHSIFFRPVFCGVSGWTDRDLDELAAEALKLVATNKCEERDADMRARIKELAGEDVPWRVQRS
jgi:hypothetical protein